MSLKSVLFPLTHVSHWRTSVLALALGLLALQALPHSVGQVQTTKFFAPETVKMLQDRISGGGTPGFQVGDTLSYIIQFTPVFNNASRGANGYLTDYVPPGTVVTGAAFVNKGGVDANGNDTYYEVSPALPGSMPAGWGASGANTYSSTFAVNAYDSTGRCAAAARPAGQCNGRLADLYADTGIFYSTDARTQQFPALPTRLNQTANGYYVNATREGQLNPIIGQTDSRTHNLWDAAMTNAFGTQALTAATPNANGTVRRLNGSGAGTTPYNAGSAVAGPQSGYQLDYTGQVGPWQRVAYPGSRMGDNSIGPARAMSQNAPLGDNATGLVNAPPLPLHVTGDSTSLGYPLSSANPLPAGTNAVRWAVGELLVGQINYVKITLRVTQPPPVGGIVNGSEVFGGDASGLTGSGTSGSIDSPWVYHVPSVADTNSNLYIQKTPCVYDPTATNCTPLSGTYHAGNSTVTYRITYLNPGNLPQNNVVLRDQVPCQTATGNTVVVGAITGPLASLAPLNSLPYTTATTAGNCTAPATRTTLTFPTIATLAAGQGGRMIVNIKNNATTTGEAVVNTATLTSVEVPGGVSSNGVTFVGSAATPALAVSKSTPTPSSTAGGSVQYVIVVENTGTGPATGIQIDDLLPSNGDGVVNPATRFNYASTVSIGSTGLTTSTALVTSTTTAALSGLAPYNGQGGAANSVNLRYAFGASSSLAAGGRITVTFNVNVGSAINASATPYYNNVVARGTAGNTYRVDSGSVAPVSVSGALSVSKSMSCYFVGGNCVAANSGSTIPANSRVRYRIDYANTGAGALTNVVLTDSLPCQISSTAASVTVTAVLSGPLSATGTTPYNVPGPFTGNCPSTRGSLSFPPATLAAGQTGALELDVQLTTPPGTTSAVVNNVSLSGGGFVASDQHQATVQNLASLNITKSVSPASVPPGGTVLYTITLSNVGTTAAQTVTVYDWLPTGTATVADATRRFSHTGTTAFSGALTGVATGFNLPPTQAPYSAGTYAANQQELVWSFGAQTLPVGASASISFVSVVGSNLPTLAPPNYYYNNAKVTYHNGQQASAGAAGANVSLVANLSVTKTNATSALTAGGTTTYTLVASNGGPSAAHGALLQDSPGAGLICSNVSCPAGSLTGGASCPVTPANLLTPAGTAIPLFPANSSVTLLVDCQVTASGQ